MSLKLNQRTSEQWVFPSMSPPVRKNNIVEMNIQSRISEIMNYEPKDVVYVEKMEDGRELIHYDEKNMILNKAYNVEWYGSKLQLIRNESRVIIIEQ